MSFCPNPPQSGATNDKVILGVLPANQPDGSSSSANPSIENFEPNPTFVQTLQQAIRQVLDRHADETLEAEAKARGEGWMHICDNRITPTLNRVPDPEDILGSVMVVDGKIIPSSYQTMPSYRVVSGESGPLVLSEAVHAALTSLQKEYFHQEPFDRYMFAIGGSGNSLSLDLLPSQPLQAHLPAIQRYKDLFLF